MSNISPGQAVSISEVRLMKSSSETTKATSVTSGQHVQVRLMTKATSISRRQHVQASRGPLVLPDHGGMTLVDNTQTTYRTKMSRPTKTAPRTCLPWD